MTDDELLLAAAPLLRELPERGVLEGELAGDGETFILLLTAPTDGRAWRNNFALHRQYHRCRDFGTARPSVGGVIGSGLESKRL